MFWFHNFFSLSFINFMSLYAASRQLTQDTLMLVNHHFTPVHLLFFFHCSLLQLETCPMNLSGIFWLNAPIRECGWKDALMNHILVSAKCIYQYGYVLLMCNAFKEYGYQNKLGSFLVIIHYLNSDLRLGLCFLLVLVLPVPFASAFYPFLMGKHSVEGTVPRMEMDSRKNL